MVVTSSKEPAWAYPRPSRGRRLHNKRVHPGRSSWWDHQVNPSCHLPFLLPCPPPAISQQPSTTSHLPPSPGHLHTGALLHMGISSFFLTILPSLVLPYFESRVESSHDTFSRLSGVSSLMSAICCFLRRRNLCAIFTVAGYVELNHLPNTCSTTPTIDAS